MTTLNSCADSSEQQTDQKIKVLSSFSILTEMVEAIGGELVEVHNLVPVGTDPHEYDPKPEDIKFASKADLFLYNGLNLEGGDKGWYMKLLNRVMANSDCIFEITKDVQPMYIVEQDGRKEVNPHAFISPAVGIVMSRAIQNALISVDSAHKEFYEQQTQKYINQLEAIDQDYRNKIAEIPETQRVFVTSERAFQYLAAEYGLNEGFIWAIDTEENGSPEQIKNTIAFVKKYNPKVLFVESNVDRRPMETVSKETKVAIYKEPLFSDELGKPGKEADTYIKYLAYNLEKIYDGLK